MHCYTLHTSWFHWMCFYMWFCLSTCIRPCGRTGKRSDDGLWPGPLFGCVCIWTCFLLGGRRRWTTGDITLSSAELSQTKARSQGLEYITVHRHHWTVWTVVWNAKLLIFFLCFYHLKKTYSRVDIPLPVPVIQVACGKTHSLALTKGKTMTSLEASLCVNMEVQINVFLTAAASSHHSSVIHFSKK